MTIEGERTCPTCKVVHKGEKIPPSLVNRTKVCYDCYKAKKTVSDKAWREKNRDVVRQYKKDYRAEHPAETRKEWKARTERWKRNKKLRREKRSLHLVNRGPTA